MHRRHFLAGSGALAAMAWPERLAALDALVAVRREAPAAQLADDEGFWRSMRPFWVVPTDRLDLDQATFGAMGTPVFDALMERSRQLHQAPSSRAEELWQGELVAAREALATLLGVDATQLALTAGGGSALGTVLDGIPLARGDVVLVTDHASADVRALLARRAAREGVVVRTVALPAGESTADAAATVVGATDGAPVRLALLPHVSAWTGAVLPVDAISTALRQRGAAVVVDGTHAVGVLEVDVPAIGCDAYAAQLDVWLGAPLGTGVVVLREAWIERVAPLVPHGAPVTPPVRRLEWSGGALLAERATVRDALTFQRTLGAARKRARLALLAGHWQSRLAELRGLRLLSPRGGSGGTGIASFTLDAVPSSALARHLRSAHGVVVRALEGPAPGAHLVRVSPAPFTTPAELDRLVLAVREVARRGLPEPT